MKKQVIKITIDTKGALQTQAMEGFEGTSCVQQTRPLEMALAGGEANIASTEHTKEYYNGEGGSPDQNLNL